IFPSNHDEIQRLLNMTPLLLHSTSQFLKEAGVTTGMSVLDLGSGIGDVAFIAADLVGPTGKVVGIERNPTLLSVAQRRAEAARLTQVTFLQADITSLLLETTVD